MYLIFRCTSGSFGWDYLIAFDRHVSQKRSTVDPATGQDCEFFDYSYQTIGVSVDDLHLSEITCDKLEDDQIYGHCRLTETCKTEQAAISFCMRCLMHDCKSKIHKGDTK